MPAFGGFRLEATDFVLLFRVGFFRVEFRFFLPPRGLTMITSSSTTRGIPHRWSPCGSIYHTAGFNAVESYSLNTAEQIRKRMGDFDSISITIPKDLLHWIDLEVNDGRWPSRSNAVRKALEHIRKFHSDPLQV